MYYPTDIVMEHWPERGIAQWDLNKTITLKIHMVIKHSVKIYVKSVYQLHQLNLE